ncbi:MAG TPA: TonB-dependent receptor [Vicinamibacterales bacterium]
MAILLRVVLVLSLAVSAAAQGTNAALTGTVTDDQGGVLPGVTVTVRNVETGTVRTVVTEADGQYRVPALLPGRYDVTGELSGFSTVSASGINLATNQEVRQNLRLTVATLQETITVTAEAPVIEVSKTEVAAVITKEQLEMLPVTNRALVTLSLLLPGTSQDGTRPRRNNAQVGAGTLQFTTLALADGTLNMSTKAGEPRQDFPQAAVREVRVVTSSAPAEFGGRAGGVVSVVTRGGTNAFSGEAYEYFRNEALDRMDKYTEADLEARGQERPPFSRHQFGGALGGPIIRDRLHFFVAAEQTSEEEPYRVTTGVPNFYGKYEGVFPDTRRDRLFFVRGDMQLNSSQNAFARWAYQGNWNPCEGCGGDTFGGSDTYIPRSALVAGHTWVMGTRYLNEFRFQWGGQHQYQGPTGAPRWTDYQSFPPERFQYLQQQYDFPSFDYEPDNVYFVHHAPVKPEFRNDFSIATSSHNIKLGGAYQNLTLKEDAQGNAAGSWIFSSDQPFDHENPTIMANLRDPVQFTAAFPPLVRHQPHDYYQAYVQDDWRILSNVTLNLGLRYEIEKKIWAEDRDNNTYYPRPLPFVDFASRGDTNNWSPRLGMAWDVRGTGQSVVRLAAGRQYNVIMNGVPQGELGAMLQNSITIRNPTYPDPYGGRPPASFVSTAPPNISIMSDFAGDNPYPDTAWENPYSDMYTVGASQELGADLALHADGVYIKSDKFNAGNQINERACPTCPLPYPQWGRINQIQSVGWQDYRALLMRLEKRFSRNHQYTVSYTLGRVIDNSFSGTSTGNINNVYHPELDEGYGLADRRHGLVASGATLIPGDVTIGAVWTLRSSRPFTATTSVDLDGNRNNDYVPGTKKGDGNRMPMDQFLGLVNAFRATRNLGPVSESQIQSDQYNRMDLRVSKAFQLAGNRLELIGQVFNLFGSTNLGGIGITRQTNAQSAVFGQILGAQPRQQGELAIRFVF